MAGRAQWQGRGRRVRHRSCRAWMGQVSILAGLARRDGNHRQEPTMTRMIFVNLPVADLKASMAFYEALGFTNNPQFTDETAACMVWSEAIYVMLLTHDKWRSFTTRPIPPASSSE